MVFSLADAPEADPQLLGGKGAGLVRMHRLGLPVPPGFVLSTECGRVFLDAGQLPEGVESEVVAQTAMLEAAAGRRFGDPEAPMLVSVRSGAAVSMPGMMDTVLNVGLTAAGADALARETGDARFAYSSFERLLEGFAGTVRGISRAVLEDVLLDLAADAGPPERCEALLDAIRVESGAPFPDAKGQLREAIGAVFASWNSPRARAYRRHKDIDDALGTAVVVQLMVFGNRGANSASGVAFTRDPSTGAPGAFGDVLFDAQGEDVVSGERDTEPLAALGERLPDTARELQRAFSTLEREARDLCEVEFTVERGRLWILQTRVGQRSGRAAVRLAVDLVAEGLITRADAVGRVSDEQLESARAPVFAEPAPRDRTIACGLAVSPGAAVGRAVFESAHAQERARGDDPVILLRPTTAPADLPGVLAAAAIVTGRGGRASHAAVVARGLGRPAVCSAGKLDIAPGGGSATLAGELVEAGEILSVDGDRGIVARGAQPLAAAETDARMAAFLRWRAESAEATCTG